MKCQTFDIGIGRVAGRSICRAIGLLGVQSRHGFNGNVRLEKDAIEKFFRNKTDYDIYDTCEYISNIASIHWRQLADSYPEAKFILPVRPVGKWLRP